MIDELEGMSKEAVVAYLWYYLSICLEELKIKTKEIAMVGLRA
jgi:hypothetical protein